MSTEKKKDTRLPVTIISGFLGSGKTTLLKHLLENTQKLRIALVVNDMAELNIDAALVKRKGAELSKMEGEDGKMIELDNGCICCSLKPNMIKEVNRLAKDGKFDYLVIESSGICEPMPIAEAFYEDEENESEELNAQGAMTMLSKIARLDTMVTVVDATRFWEYLNSLNTLIQQYGKDKVSAEEGKRSLANLLIDQVEFANVILVNKHDLMKGKDTELKQVKELVKKLNPTAELHDTTFSKIDTKKVLSTGLFDLNTSQLGAGWVKELQKQEDKKSAKEGTKTTKENKEHGHGHGHGNGHGGGHKHGHKEHECTTSCTENKAHSHGDHYGISSFVYRRRKPFHPARLHEVLNGADGIKGVMRSKGFCWLSSRHATLIEWNMAGKICQLEPGGEWFAEDMDFKEELEDEPEALEKILADFVEPWGDRRNELVMIGFKMDQKAVEAILDKCLLTEEEMKLGVEGWARMKDEFPEFPKEYEDDE